MNLIDEHAAAPRPVHDWPRPGYAWYVVVLLTLAYALAILDRTALALLIQPLQASLRINDTQFGLLQGMAFSIAYSLLGLPFGLLADRARRVWILVGGLTVWSLATMACGLAQTFEQLFAARMAVGAGEAVLVPVASSLIADYFAPAMRPKAYGLFVAGTALGGSAAMTLTGLFLASAGGLINDFPDLFGPMQPWQVVLMMCGAPGLALAAAIMLTMQEPKRQDASQMPARPSLRPVFELMIRQRAAYGSLLGGGVLNLVCVYAIVGWFPALFIRAHNWSAPSTGWTLGAVGLPFSLLSGISSGWVISWLHNRGHRDAPMLVAAMAGLSFVIFGAGACVLPSASTALVAYGLMSFFTSWNISAVYSGVAQITPNELRGQVMAIQTIVSGLVALTAGNFIVGFMSDRVFTRPDGIALSLAAVFGSCGVAATLILLGGRRAFRHAARSLEVEQALPSPSLHFDPYSRDRS